MTADPVKQRTADPAVGEAYIRGGGVTLLDRRRLRRTLIRIAVVLLAAVTLVLAVDAGRDALTLHRLRSRGQTVEVTVTGCLGRASGTGITPAGYRCRGTFVLRGRRHTAVIAGSSSLRPAGQTLFAVTDPDSPTAVRTLHSLSAAAPAWHGFVPPALLLTLLLTLLLGTGAATWPRRVDV